MCFCNNTVKYKSKLDLLPLSVNVLDEAVRDSVPGEGLVSSLPKDRVVAEVSCSVDHLKVSQNIEIEVASERHLTFFI